MWKIVFMREICTCVVILLVLTLSCDAAGTLPTPGNSSNTSCTWLFDEGFNEKWSRCPAGFYASCRYEGTEQVGKNAVSCCDTCAGKNLFFTGLWGLDPPACECAPKKIRQNHSQDEACQKLSTKSAACAADELAIATFSAHPNVLLAEARIVKSDCSSRGAYDLLNVLEYSALEKACEDLQGCKWNSNNSQCQGAYVPNLAECFSKCESDASCDCVGAYSVNGSGSVLGDGCFHSSHPCQAVSVSNARAALPQPSLSFVGAAVYAKVESACIAGLCGAGEYLNFSRVQTCSDHVTGVLEPQSTMYVLPNITLEQAQRHCAAAALARAAPVFCLNTSSQCLVFFPDANSEMCGPARSGLECFLPEMACLRCAAPSRIVASDREGRSFSLGDNGSLLVDGGWEWIAPATTADMCSAQCFEGFLLSRRAEAEFWRLFTSEVEEDVYRYKCFDRRIQDGWIATYAPLWLYVVGIAVFFTWKLHLRADNRCACGVGWVYRCEQHESNGSESASSTDLFDCAQCEWDNGLVCDRPDWRRARCEWARLVLGLQTPAFFVIVVLWQWDRLFMGGFPYFSSASGTWDNPGHVDATAATTVVSIFSGPLLFLPFLFVNPAALYFLPALVARGWWVMTLACGLLSFLNEQTRLGFGMNYGMFGGLAVTISIGRRLSDWPHASCNTRYLRSVPYRLRCCVCAGRANKCQLCQARRASGYSSGAQAAAAIKYNTQPNHLECQPPWGDRPASEAPSPLAALRFNTAFFFDKQREFARDDAARTVSCLAATRLKGSVCCKARERSYFEVKVAVKGGLMLLGWWNKQRDAFWFFDCVHKQYLYLTQKDFKKGDCVYIPREMKYGVFVRQFRDDSKMIDFDVDKVIVVENEWGVVSLEGTCNIDQPSESVQCIYRMGAIYYVAVNRAWNVDVSAGDVIGLGCDLTGNDGKLHVSLNGDWLPPKGLDIDLPQECMSNECEMWPQIVLGAINIKTFTLTAPKYQEPMRVLRGKSEAWLPVPNGSSSCAPLHYSVGSTLGFKWKAVGLEKPKLGTEITNAPLLQSALQHKVNFTKEEVDGFEVTHLSYNSYIKVGNTYFRPAARTVACEAVKQLPQGLSVNPSTGEISGTFESVDSETRDRCCKDILIQVVDPWGRLCCSKVRIHLFLSESASGILSYPSARAKQMFDETKFCDLRNRLILQTGVKIEIPASFAPTYHSTTFHVKPEDMSILKDLGLSLQEETGSLEGVPMKTGDFDVKIEARNRGGCTFHDLKLSLLEPDMTFAFSYPVRFHVLHGKEDVWSPVFDGKLTTAHLQYTHLQYTVASTREPQCPCTIGGGGNMASLSKDMLPPDVSEEELIAMAITASLSECPAGNGAHRPSHTTALGSPAGVTMCKESKSSYMCNCCRTAKSGELWSCAQCQNVFCFDCKPRFPQLFVERLPQGLSLNPSTGKISGTLEPDDSVTGERCCQIRIKAMDPLGRSRYTNVRMHLFLSERAPESLSYPSAYAMFFPPEKLGLLPEKILLARNSIQEFFYILILQTGVRIEIPANLTLEYSTTFHVKPEEMSILTEDLGLSLQEETGSLEGVPMKMGNFELKIEARNSAGSSFCNLRFSIVEPDIPHGFSYPAHRSDKEFSGHQYEVGEHVQIVPERRPRCKHYNGEFFFMIAPRLPAGWRLDSSTGVIESDAEDELYTTEYVVTAFSDTGADCCAIVRIKVAFALTEKAEWQFSQQLTSLTGQTFIAGRSIDNRLCTTRLTFGTDKKMGMCCAEYFSKPKLPAGLQFDEDGQIWGVPLELSSRRTYTIYAVIRNSVKCSKEIVFAIKMPDGLPSYDCVITEPVVLPHPAPAEIYDRSGASATSNRSPPQLQDYEYEHSEIPLGEGGQGIVYLARLRDDPAQKVAIKVCDLSYVRLNREVQNLDALSDLKHPNVVRFIAFLEENNAVVMEYIDGKSLKMHLHASKGRLKWDEASVTMRGILSGLRCLHTMSGRPMLHRDVNPSNVMLRTTPVNDASHVVLVDFGLSKRVNQKGQTMTEGQRLIGTAAYLSYEVVTGMDPQKWDTRVDVWAAGVTMYEMLAGKRPFTGENDQNDFSLWAAIKNAKPQSIATAGSGVNAFLFRALEKDRARRFTDAKDMLEVFQEVCRDRHTVPKKLEEDQKPSPLDQQSSAQKPRIVAFFAKKHTDVKDMVVQIQSMQQDQSMGKAELSQEVIALIRSKIEHLNVYKEAEKLIMGYSHSRSCFEVEVHPQPTFELFSECLVSARERNVCILHFAGHGHSRCGFVWLKEATEYEEVSMDHFADLFKTEAAGSGGTIECVILNACETEKVGKKLRNSGVPHVICWRSEVQDVTAMNFAKWFYMSLDQQNERDYMRAFEHAANRLDGGSPVGDAGSRMKVKHKARGAVDFVCLLSKDGDKFPEPRKSKSRESELKRVEPDLQPCSHSVSTLDDIQISDVTPLLSSSTSEVEVNDEAPTRNWKLPKGKDDYGALAGKHEKLALSALEFNMKFCGKDLKVGNGIQANGFLENCVFKQWGVWNYLELWGASGKAVEKARQLLEKHQITKLVDAAKSLKAALLQRNEDMKKNAAKRKCKGSCSTNVLCSACKGARKRTRCSACQHLNCQACLAREQHVHVYTLISESQRAIEELLQEYRA